MSGRAGIYMPEGWAAIPLRDPQSRARAISALIDTQFASAPQATALRREMHKALTSAAADAARADGELMAMSMITTDGVPVPMSLTVFRPQTPGTLERVKGSLMDQPDVHSAEGPQGTVVRQVRIDEGVTTSTVPGMRQVIAEYWLDPEDGHGLYRAVFTSPLTETVPALLELFDTIVSSVGVVREDQSK